MVSCVLGWGRSFGVLLSMQVGIEDHDSLATTSRCCGGGGVNNMEGFPNSVGWEGGVRRYGRKSCDKGARGCRSPPWRCCRGVLTPPHPLPGLVIVSGRKPRSV